MNLYYTSVTAQDAVQADPRLSLGGYKSASPVPNNSFDNLFGEITQFLLSKTIPEDEYIGVILKNETAAAVENLWLWFDYGTNPYSKILVAAVDLAADSAGVLKMEHIPNRISKPIYADFYEADGIENAVSLGNLAVGGMLGLWFCRQLIENLATTIQEDSDLYETDPLHPNMVRAITPAKQDIITVSFRYGSDYYGGPIGSELL
jgi:hypothetical protein